MPKIKTHKTAQKRFKISGTGKILRTKGGKSHLRRKKAARVLRALDKTFEVTTRGEKKRISRLAPYLKP
ncbi:MAG TPA: 50S ribosomal protein L35 [Anaerolineae bacterium]|nr:50S ribosomal protein L35 [Anaerolineae bacterium]HOR01385.1 50S ribosomal protein L35 [Anaerolineae bacterium]HPL26954.1 50S ribosomal protein L35 [Anaerolineae bacterium]